MSDKFDSVVVDSTTTAATAGHDRLVLVFDYRSLFEAEDVDMINFEAWKEVLDSFGYGDLTYPHFMRSLVFKSPSEVMTALCPYTTKAEWGPILNKRHVRLNKDISSLCYAEMLPIVGLKDFIIDCAKQSLVTCIFLSPFPDDVTRTMLELAEISPYIDLVHSYTDREFSLLEALEMINIKPSKLPEGIEHRWSDDANRLVLDEATGTYVKATTGSDEVSRANGVLNPADVVVVCSDTYGCDAAASLGCKVVGITYNGGYYGLDDDEYKKHIVLKKADGTATDEKSGTAHEEKEERQQVLTSSPSRAGGEPTPIPSTAAEIGAHTEDYELGRHEQALLMTGASVVLEDFSELKYEYIQYLRIRGEPHPLDEEIPPVVAANDESDEKEETAAPEQKKERKRKGENSDDSDYEEPMGKNE